jgi:hypothetical protein
LGTIEESGIVSSFLVHIQELAERAKVIIVVLLASTIFFMLFPANPLDLLSPASFLTGFYRPMISVVLEDVKNYVAPSTLQIISLQMGILLRYMFSPLFFLGLLLARQSSGMR